MRSKWFRGSYIWGVAGLVAVALVAAGGSLADPGDKDHGYLGVYMQKLTRDVRDGLDLDVKKGVLVSGVQEDSPAAKAGLEDGDVIVEFNGESVSSPDDLRDLVGDTEPGTEVEIVVIREGDRKTLEVVVGERPDDWSVFDWSDDGHRHGLRWFSNDGDHWLGDSGRQAYAMFLGGPKLGVTAAELNEGLADYFDAAPGEGILVLEVIDDSIAEEAGIEAGDVIQKVDDNSIASVDDLRESLSDFEEGDEFEVTILRKGKTQKLSATMNDQSLHSFWSGNAPHVDIKQFKGGDMPRIHIDRDDLDETLDELREEINKLKKEIKKLKEDA